MTAHQNEGLNHSGAHIIRARAPEITLHNTDHETFTLRVAPPEEVSSSWPKIREHLDRAIEYCGGDFDSDDILRLVGERRAFIILMETGGEIVLAAACEIQELPKKRVMFVMALGGSGLDVLAMHFWSRIQGIAAVLKVDAVRGAVRPSMQRYYRRIAPDAVVAYTILERAV